MSIFFTQGSITVNIHNVGRIPFFNMEGPKYRISISRSLYQKVKADYPNVIIYPVDNDPIMAKKIAERKKANAEKESIAEKIVMDEKVVIEKVPVATEEVGVTKRVEISVDDKIDDIVKNLPVEDSPIIQPTKEDLIEIESTKATKVSSNKKRYTYLEAVALTKAQLKKILNEDRGFAPGSEFYGGYHDNHDVLVKYVLDSQE